MNLEEWQTYWQVLKKRWWVIAVLTATTLVTMLFIAFTSKRQYKASIRFQVIGAPPGAVSVYSDLRASTVREEIGYTRSNFLQVFRSYNLAWEIAQALGLQMAPEDLMERISVEEVKDTDLIDLSVIADDPQSAAELANKTMDIGQRLYGRLAAGSLTDSRQFITQQLATAKEDLDAANRNLNEFKIENRLSSAELVIESQLTLIRSLTQDRDAALVRDNTEQVQNYDKIIAQRQLELQDLVKLSERYDALEEAVRRAGSVYSYLLDRQTEAKLKENETLNVSFVQTLGPARPPSHPLSPLNFKVFALGIGVSLVLGVALAFLWEYMATANRSVRSAEAAMIDKPDRLAAMAHE